MLDTTKIIFVISTLPEDIYVDVKRVSTLPITPARLN